MSEPSRATRYRKCDHIEKGEAEQYAVLDAGVRMMVCQDCWRLVQADMVTDLITIAIKRGATQAIMSVAAAEKAVKT